MSDAVPESSEVAAARVAERSPAGAGGAKEATPRTAPVGRQTGPAARAASFPVMQNGAMAALSQQGCACGGGEPPQIVYALGSLWLLGSKVGCGYCVAYRALDFAPRWPGSVCRLRRSPRGCYYPDAEHSGNGPVCGKKPTRKTGRKLKRAG
jgi:hypothetical protein